METEKKEDSPPSKKIKIYKTAAVYNPHTKKVQTKSFTGYEPEELAKNCLEWKTETKAKYKADMEAKIPKGPAFTLESYVDPELPANGAVSWVLCGASRSGKSTFLTYLDRKSVV